MWIDPKIDWTIIYDPSPSDLNRIEGNIKHIKEENGTISGDKTFPGDNTHSGNNQFSGNNVHSGNNEFSGDNVHSGDNEFSGNNIHSHIETDNSGSVKVKHKLITGTASSGYLTNFNPGIDPNKILSASGFVIDSGNWYSDEGFVFFSSSSARVYWFDAVTGTYRIHIMYEA